MFERVNEPQRESQMEVAVMSCSRVSARLDTTVDVRSDARERCWPRVATVGACILAILSPLLNCSEVPAGEPDNPLAGNEKVAEIFDTFQGRGVQPDDSNPTPASEAVKQFRLRDGFAIDLVASEPNVSQPLFLSWDSRGRMWVVQYRQYQYPAGLKVVRFDHHLRAVFDKVPEPPPRGTPGADKITVFEDTDGDGRYDTSKDVITGLNIVSSVAVGRGGIWVLNPPYLLFYPDRDRDDVPDADPEVHLSGFGLQDTHSVASSLMWGPDGWLYAANGSTTHGTISSEATKGVSFQGQCIWRYHPGSKVFEIYAEGGGNTFSCEIDAKGRVFSGTNFGSTRGLYYPQGAYFIKNWGKHGALTNPHAFGFFQHMQAEGDSRRFAQAFTIYEGGLFPPEYDGTIVAPNAMTNLVWSSRLLPTGSYFRTVDEQNLVTSPDRWFRPVYAGVGPDGAVYIADWYDTRLSHVSPVDNWHKESGRVYRLRPADSAPKYSLGDLHELSSDKLVAAMGHPNKWIRRRAALELGWRGDRSVVPKLDAGLASGSLESLWALNLLGEFTNHRALKMLGHTSSDIRRWTVRLLGDRTSADSRRHPATSGPLDSEVMQALAAMAATEPNVHVRSQLASCAKRLETEFAMPLITTLLTRDEDASDIHMPLMIWWALEAHCNDHGAIRRLLADPQLWSRPLVKSTVLERLMRRYASSGEPDDLAQCDQLARAAPDENAREILINGLNKAFQGRALPELPDSLSEALTQYQRKRGTAGVVLALRQGNEDAVEPALAALRDSSVEVGIRIELARAFGEVSRPQVVDTLLRLARYTAEPALQRVALQSLARYDNPKIATAIARAFDGPISNEHNLRKTGCRTLASRADWAKVLLEEVNDWRLKPRDIPPDVVQKLRTYQDSEIVAAVEKAFGKAVAISAPEKIAEIRRLRELLKKSSGDADRGSVHYAKKCGTCHQLFGKGENIGPPLDAYDRGNVMF